MNEYEAFITMVLGDMVGNAILGLRDRPGRMGKVNRYTDFKYPDQLDEMVQFCADHRNEDLYISPLVYGDERGENGNIRRTPENALTSQTIYQDSDTCTPDNFRLQPSIHVTTSTGRYQDFWVLTEPVTAAEAAEVSHRIAIAHRDQGSDPSSWSANKVLRIPHSINTSHGFPESVEVQYSAEVYNYLDVSGAYDDVEYVQRPIIRLPADVSYESADDLPDYADALDKLPPDFDVSVLTKEVPDAVDRSRMRYRILCDLFRTGTLEFNDVLSLAWHAPVSRKWKEDSRNIRGLIAEALKAQLEVSYASGEGIEAPAAEEHSRDELVSAILISNSERESISGDDNWLRDWEDWNRRKLDRAFNAPYVRLNGWLALSAAFSEVGYMPMSNGPEDCNLYGMGIGDSGTGKSSAYKVWLTMMSELFPNDPGWDVGSNASPNALHEKLIERDNKVTVFNDDEVHGWFSTVNSQQWATGTYQDLAKYYDGRVPPILRTGNREISGKSAKTIFLMLLYGTRKGEISITNVLNKSMFLSGFLARFIWAIGETREITEDALVETQSNGEYTAMGYEPWARQWAAEFENTKKKLRAETKSRRVAVPMSADALRRLGKMKWAVHQMYQKHPQWEILEPCLIRFGSNIRRAATLLALQEGAKTVTLRHLLIAMESGEEWLTSMVTMADLISESDWKRQESEMLDFITNRSTRVRREVVMRKFSALKPRERAEMVGSLIEQGLIEERQQDGAKWLTGKV